MSMNSVVVAAVRLEAARAALRVESLAAQERTTPSLQGTNNSRLTLARKICEARDQESSWKRVLRYVENPEASDGA